MTGIYQGFPSLEAFAEHYRVFDPTRPVSREEQLRRINWPYLIAQALEARKHASSYRNFHVGCAVWAFKSRTTELRGRWAIFTGSNIKLAKDSRPICAEQFAFGAVRSGGYDQIIAMVVAGEPQEDAESGLLSHTLHPCGECRKIFQATPEISPDTLLLTITPGMEAYERLTIRELIALHRRAEERHCQ